MTCRFYRARLRSSDRTNFMGHRPVEFSGPAAGVRPKQPLTSHHVEDPNAFAVRAIKDPAGRLDNLPVSRTTELRWYGPALGVPFQLFDRFEDSLDEMARSL